MKNEVMLNEFIELATTDAISGKEAAVADKLVEKLSALGFAVSRDNAGEAYGGECGNVIAIREGELDGALFFSAQGMKTIGVATGYSKNHTTAEQLVLEDFYKSGQLAEAMIWAFAKRCKAK